MLILVGRTWCWKHGKHHHSGHYTNIQKQLFFHYILGVDVTFLHVLYLVVYMPANWNNRLKKLINIEIANVRNKEWENFIKKCSKNPLSSKPFWQKINQFRNNRNKNNNDLKVISVNIEQLNNVVFLISGINNKFFFYLIFSVMSRI